ncbi:MAG: type II toxin-antitoxin system VapC family toxin [Candidatus Marinimicrobia bacterium]|nr:type II toxin-antitoxin system VapC family toxin [Candidatus Neomarinimicrobiota bacterium]
MILIDTSIWIDHLRQGSKHSEKLLSEFSIFSHPFIIGELACGNLRNRQQIIHLLQELPQALVASDDEVLKFIDVNHLTGKGLGYVDMHLLASTKLSGLRIWTRDRRMKEAAITLDVNWNQQ